jgi:DNA-binding XRE family transcriptional regulator
MVSNKGTLILASSVATISLATLLVATALHRRRHKSPRTQGFLEQTRSIKGVNTTSAIHREQLKEKSPESKPTPWQESKTKAVKRFTTNNATDISKNTTPVAVPSPSVPSSIPDSAVITPSSYQTPEEEEISVSDEAKKSGESLKELIVTAIKEAKDSTKGTGKRLKEQTINNIAATTDSKDIHSLGDNVNALVGLFEVTMIEIRKERYDQQIKLLDSYKDLLQKHIKVIYARGRMARKLKPSA